MNCSIFKVLFVHFCCLTLLTFHFGICIGSSEILCIPSERDALVRFKHHLEDPSNRLSSWNASNTKCCEWEGVVCSNLTAHILQLHLNTSFWLYDYEAYSRSRFGGEINPSLVDLKHLGYLDLSGNYFGGMQIPSFLGAITTLTYLNLSEAGFDGKIPHEIGNLSNLLYLDLSFAAHGEIPHQIGNLTNLIYLDLQSDEFESLFAENLHWLSGLSYLQYLDLSYANLSKSFDWLQTLQALPSLMELRLPHSTLQYHNQPSIVNFSSLITLDLSYTNSLVPKRIFGLRKLVSLQLNDNNIQGPIPDCIQNLTLLQNLDLSENSLSSSIPDWLYSLHHLKFLNLRSNHLRGTISDSMGNLTSLVGPDFSLNQLEGKIPTSLGNLISLVGLDLSDNQLEGKIPSSLGNFTSLVELDLSRNQLEGKIPSSLGNLTSVVRLDLSENQLQGKIPTSLGSLCNLREIDFSYLKLNQQVNEILDILAPCVSHGLTSLDLSNSQLSGNLTDQIGVFQNILTMDFSNNSIHGALPTSFAKLSSLSWLVLSKNKCNGALPTSFGQLSSLEKLDLSENQFDGNPFEVIKSLYELSVLYIDDNLFQGVVKEDDLANLTSLTEFSASGNNFTLKVGPNWHPTFQVTELGMRSWQLGPYFPSWIQSQKNLVLLDMSNTGISDSIPTWFWEIIPDVSIYVNLSHNHIHGEFANTLKYPIYAEMVDLSSNHLHGKLPHPSRVVYWLDLSSNSFSGSLTDFLCQKQDEPMSLEFFNLGANNLSGEMPDCWIMWPDLMDVNLQSNHFVGNLPPSMGSLALLHSLNIHNNSLSGIFPPILKNTTKLISLDLGENKLTGIIPAWVGKRLLNLNILRLRSNRFLGHIPNQICDMIFLRDLDLAQNNLSGNIPKYFNHLNAMLLKNRSMNSFIHTDVDSKSIDGFIYVENNLPGISSVVTTPIWVKGRGIEYKNLLGMVTNIDLSNNNLSGEIPREITNLDGLIYLNLSKNQLTGQIPPSIGNMRSLESIDFSRNRLSGEIPSTMSNLSFLSKLDLSYNHLRGEIPTGTQLQSFEASNFVGNNLCGLPLPVNCSSNPQIPDDDHKGKKSDGHKVNGFFVSMTFGFIVGFWVVVAPLFIYKSWRYAYFRFLDDMWYKVQSFWRL